MAGFVHSPTSWIQDRKTETRGATKLKFPSDLGPHSILINFSDFKYDPSNAKVSNVISTNSIVLPLPTNIEDNLNVQAQNSDLGLTGAATIAVGKTLKGQGVSGGELSRKIGEHISKGLGHSETDPTIDDGTSWETSYAAMAKFLGRNALDVIPGAGLAVNVMNGTAVNPHTTLDFNGVTLKSHTLSWLLSPKSSSESDTLKTIINLLKKSSLPNYQSVKGNFAPRALLTYPKLINVSLMGVNQDHFLRYKPGMVQNVNVKYSQGDTVSLFAGGKPTTVAITLQFIEATIHTAEDY